MAEPPKSTASLDITRAETPDRVRLRGSIDDVEAMVSHDERKRRANTVSSARPMAHLLMKNKFKPDNSRVMKDVALPSRKRLAEVEVFSLPGGRPDPEVLKNHFLLEGNTTAL